MAEHIYIVGAHSRAQTLGAYLRYLNPDVSIKAYLFDNEEKNVEVIDGIPVIRFDKNTSLHNRYPVYIGTRGIYHSSLSKKLKELGMRQIYPVTVELDLLLRNKYLRRYFSSRGRDFIKIEDYNGDNVLTHQDKIYSQACVYVAKSVYDKPLEQSCEINHYESPIQVGAVLTSKRLSKQILTDDLGENISAKNKQYCELTALYWIWKNAKDKVVGLVHYRRHFLLPNGWLESMIAHDIDVILPIPLYVAPSVAQNYKSRHDSSDWDYMMQYLKLNHKDDYEEAKVFFEGNLYSPCNMFIMRKNVLDDLCTWLFPILDSVVAHGGQKEDSYLNRYPGFISERLITFFFEKYLGKYKVVYADKNFLP
jgi:hypothetical protein